jgi:hypothetical protein
MDEVRRVRGGIEHRFRALLAELGVPTIEEPRAAERGRR